VIYVRNVMDCPPADPLCHFLFSAQQSAVPYSNHPARCKRRNLFELNGSNFIKTIDFISIMCYNSYKCKSGTFWNSQFIIVDMCESSAFMRKNAFPSVPRCSAHTGIQKTTQNQITRAKQSPDIFQIACVGRRRTTSVKLMFGVCG